jgi:hypothetical protein
VASYTATGTAFDDIPVDGPPRNLAYQQPFPQLVPAVASTKNASEMTVDFSSK